MKLFAVLIFTAAICSKAVCERTSIVDQDPYRKYCLLASEDDAAFSSFRQYVEITGNIETVTPVLGLKYLEQIEASYPYLLERIEDFKINDTVGNPKLSDYSRLGEISPTTLRYVYTAGDIAHYFGDMSHWNIIEIGGGYGGQCRILTEMFPLNKYTLVDLPETLQLAEKYLQGLNVPNVEYLPPEELHSDTRYDLVISNFAFSECKREAQEEYLNEVIQFSERGYMICNFVSHAYEIRSLSSDELIEILEGFGFHVDVVAEKPSSVPEGMRVNRVFIWHK